MLTPDDRIEGEALCIEHGVDPNRCVRIDIGDDRIIFFGFSVLPVIEGRGEEGERVCTNVLLKMVKL
jgi:hypothetical protein